MTVPRNSLCPCGSGNKYKRCCGRAAETVVRHSVDLDALVQEGLACHQRREYQKAEVAYGHVLSHDPEHVDALHFMGVLAHEFGKNALAVDLISRALAKRSSAGMHYNLGQALRALGRWSDAAHHYAAAASLAPDWLDPQVNLGTTELECGRVGQARAAWQRALDLEPENPVVISNVLMAQLYDPAETAESIAARHRQLGARFLAPATKVSAPAAEFRSSDTTLLRVGFVSGDLRRHPVGLLLRSLLPALQQQGIQVNVYSNNPANDDVSTDLRARLSQWRDITSLDDAQAAQLIRADGIDILLDLSGHTAHNRMSLFARRAAPCQVSWLGYGATTGLSEMDHILVDPWCVRPEEASGYTERLCFLPHSRLFYSTPTGAPPVAELPALRKGHITFGCFNHLAKLNTEVLGLWARLLAELPTARLMLKSRQYDEARGRSHLEGLLQASGIDISRCDIKGHSDSAGYFAAFAEIDIALDPFPFSGGTTTLDGLWMGVPALTLKGGHMIARQTESINGNLGLLDWTAVSPVDYVELARRQALDLACLADLRSGLRQRLSASPICDIEAYAKNLVDAFMALRQCPVDTSARN